ncbi:MAG: hypothetical protein WBL44_12730 [Nitrososphaeraceae archaeon]|jgi:hypothetical protein
MAKTLSERLSQEDIKFLMNLLHEAEEEANTEFRMDGDNKVEAQLAINRINRIRLAVMDLNERSKK